LAGVHPKDGFVVRRSISAGGKFAMLSMTPGLVEAPAGSVADVILLCRITKEKASKHVATGLIAVLVSYRQRMMPTHIVGSPEPFSKVS
jgi:hypothetical protein